jgi:hypothetical protein
MGWHHGMRFPRIAVTSLRGLIAMDCVGCGSAAASEWPDRTAQSYRRFRCRGCSAQFNERSGGVLNRASLPSDIIPFVVFCRLRYRLTLRDLSEIMLSRGVHRQPRVHPTMGGEAAARDGRGFAQAASWHRAQLRPELVCRRNLPQGPGPLVLLVSGDRPPWEPDRHDAERHPRYESGPKILPFGTVGRRLCAGPGDNRPA